MNRAKLATDPETSAMTKISGLAGRGGLKIGVIGTPPVDIECAHRAPQVERAVVALAALAREAHRHLAAERDERAVHARPARRGWRA